MKKHHAIIVAALCCFTQPAFAGKYFAVTPSGKPEANFSGSADETSSALASKCMDAQWSVVKTTPQEVICEAPLTTGRQMVAQMLMGNAYSTPPRRYFRFNIVETGGISRVQASGWVETQMPFGQIQKVDFNGADFHNSIIDFLGSAGGKAPIGTTFPNHAVMGFEAQNEMSGKYGVMRVNNVTPNMPAARAGMQAGDVVTSIAGRKFKDNEEYYEAIEKAARTETYSVEIQRDGKPMTLTLDREFRPAITETATPKASTAATSAQSVQSSSIADELTKLHKLKEQGILSDAEFEAQKKKLLSQ